MDGKLEQLARHLTDPESWGKFLRSFKEGDALGKHFPGKRILGASADTHAHHIVPRVGLGERGKEAAKKARQLLWDYDINPDFARENLVWAPNHGHADDYAEYVLAMLQEAEKTKSRTEIVDTLKRLGQEYIDQSWKEKWAAMIKK